MTESENDGKKPLARTGESLGWMVGSTVMPKKARVIEGVGMRGVLELKAELYKAQEAARLNPEARVRRRTGPIEIRNAGVAERDRRDRAAIKTDADRMADSRAALERKAAIYERMAAGMEDDETDTYNVDFFTKAGDLDDEATRLAREAHHRGSRPHAEGAPDTAGDAVWATGMVSEDMIMERQRRTWEEDERADMESSLKREEERDLKLQALEKVEQETKEGRDRAARLRRQREQAEQTKRERLKQAFLRQQVAALRAGKSGGNHAASVQK